MGNKQIAAKRNSGVDLLKLFAIFAIVLSHTVQTLGSPNELMARKDYVLPFNIATTDIRRLVLTILYYGGNLGNITFLICSCWYLAEDTEEKYQRVWEKTIFMMVEAWLFSVAILAVMLLGYGKSLKAEYILKSLFPTTFANNWYITCYLIFYAAHINLNILIRNLNQRSHLRCCVVMVGMYIIADFVIGGLFFPSVVLIWISVYFCVTYMKKYMAEIMQSKKINRALVLLGIFGSIGIIVLTNLLGLRISLLRDKLLHWNRRGNPFFIMISLGMLNLSNSGRFHSQIVNRWASMSMLVYIFHDNLLFREYIRPQIIIYIYQNFGYDKILIYVLLTAVCIFLVSSAVCFAYQALLQSRVKKVSQIVLNRLKKGYLAAEEAFLNHSSNRP